MPIERIIRRDGTTAQYHRDRITDAILKATTATGKPNAKLADSVSRKVEQILLSTYGDNATPSVEDIQDIVESAMMQSGLTKIARSYIIYRHHRAQLRASRTQPFEMSDIIPYRKIYEVLLWNMEHKCDSVASLNEVIADGHFPELVKASERRYEKEAATAAELILDRIKDVRMVIVAGPSSSGKTTTTMKAAAILEKNGARLKTINIDNYFFDLEKHPKDEFGDYDYETPQALDLKLINRDLEALVAGETVLTPHYDFKTGKRRDNVHELSLKKNDILLIDSLHGLYKGMTRNIPDSCKFRLYVETLGQFRTADGTFMRWADNRLLRRMLRDKQHRNSTPIRTLTHWHYVRTSELSHIIPFINTADMVVNTALPYEMPILKDKVFRYFPAAVKRFKDDAHRRDAYIRACRVLELLRPLKKVADDTIVPGKSLLRAFIGGSSFRYHEPPPTPSLPLGHLDVGRLPCRMT